MSGQAGKRRTDVIRRRTVRRGGRTYSIAVVRKPRAKPKR